MRRTEITVDDHGRTVLKFRKQKHRRYLMEERESGTIVLTPLELEPARMPPAPESPKEDTFWKTPRIEDVKDRVRETPLWRENA